MTCARRVTVALLSSLAVVLLGGSAWAQDPSPAPSSDTPTVTVCGTDEQPCVVVMRDDQALGLWLFLGTGTLLALTSFLLRHGRAWKF